MNISLSTTTFRLGTVIRRSRHPYDTRAIPVRYPYDTRTIPVRYPYDTRTIPVRLRYPYDTRTIPVRYPYDTRTIPVRYPYDTRTIPIRYPYDTRTIPVRYPYDTRTLYYNLRNTERLAIRRNLRRTVLYRQTKAISTHSQYCIMMFEPNFITMFNLLLEIRHGWLAGST